MQTALIKSNNSNYTGVLKMKVFESQLKVTDTESPAADSLTPSWFKAFQDLVTEYPYEPLRVEGSIPKDLNGTLYRVGPGQFTAFGKRLPHWFDGDGAVFSLDLHN